MISESDIYWITRCDSLCLLLVILSGVSGGIASVCMICNAAHNDTIYCDTKKPIYWGYRAAVALLLLSLTSGVARAFTPTTNEMAAIKIIPRIANNEDVQGISREVVDLAKDWLKELKPKKTAEKQ